MSKYNQLCRQINKNSAELRFNVKNNNPAVGSVRDG